MKGLLQLLILFPLCCIGQLITWDKTYDLDLQDYGYSIVQTDDGGYVLTGYTGDNYWPNLLVMKLTNNGDTVWNKVHGDIGHSQGFSICKATNGGFVVSGFTSETENYFDYRMYVLKLNEFGDTIWTRKMGTVNTVARRIIQTLDGSYVVLGSNYTFTATRVIISKLDNSGNELWLKTYNFDSSSINLMYSIEQSTDSNFILAGQKTKDNGNNDIWIMKLDKYGDSLWTNSYGESNFHEEGYYALPLQNGEYIVSATRKIPNYTLYDMLFLKLDNNGNLILEKSYGDWSTQIAFVLRSTADGELIASGYYNKTSGTSGMYVVKLNNQCDTIWTRVFHQNAVEFARDIHQTDDLGYIVCGGTSLTGSGSSLDIRVLKLDESGLVSTNETKSLTKSIYLKSFPNPFKDYTFLQFEIGHISSREKITIYNSKGNVIKEIPLSGILSHGKNLVPIETFDWPSGVYYGILEMSSIKISSKMIKIQ